ncbi:MAG TPA: FxLYD domain-containing protein [Coriobacteriia bacterium]|nr:FxLYD domain-containing protein [Coriobacteriia bacterium]
MPEASWCRSCRDYVWVAPDGGCSSGHPRSHLHAIYEAPAAAGVFVPPPPQRPDGCERDDSPQIDLVPQPTYWRTDPVPSAGSGEYRSSGSSRGAQMMVLVGAVTLIAFIALNARSSPPATSGAPGAAPAQSAEQLVIQDNKVLQGADGRQYVTGAVLNRSERPLRVRVTLTLYDQTGREVGRSSTELPHLVPDDAARFEIPVEQPNVASYEVTAVSDP